MDTLQQVAELRKELSNSMVSIPKLNKLIEVVDNSNKEEINLIHIIQEAAEFIIEVSKMDMGIDRPEKLKEEFSDLFFKQLKLLRSLNWTLNDLIDFCLDKTEQKFPHQIV